jgi:hypothetical protein
MGLPYDCNVIRVTMLADQTGSIVIDIWEDTYAAFDAGTLVDADTIAEAELPTISNEQAFQDETPLGGGVISLTAGNILAFHVDSCTTIERCTISLIVEK